MGLLDTVDTPEYDMLNLAKVGVEGSNPFARSSQHIDITINRRPA